MRKRWFEGWRNEAYPVGTSFYGEPLFEIERAAVPRFGIRAYGVHVNGFIKKSGSVHLWIGQRAQDKATYPGKLDNMVAGGQPVGIGLRENVLKEAYEEASVPRSIANQAISVGAITYCHGFSGVLNRMSCLCLIWKCLRILPPKILMERSNPSSYCQRKRY